VNSKRLFPVYNGFEFWLTRLDNDTHPFGYQIQETAATGAETRWTTAGGPYRTKHDATAAAFARIEALSSKR